MKINILSVILILIGGFSAISARAEIPLSEAEHGLMSGFPPAADKVVDYTNWLKPPYNRWSFQHSQMLFPSQTVSRGNHPESVLLQADSKYQRALGKAEFATGLTFDSFMSDNHVDGIIILKDGAIVSERYANGQSPDTRHILFSVTKSFTGLLMEILIHDGIVDENKIIASYIPELSASAYGDATIRQAMDMEVSLIFSEDHDDPRSEIAQFTYAANMGEPPDGITAERSLYDYLPKLRKDQHHGEKFQYSSATTEVLGWVLTRATGHSLADLFEEKIYQYIQAERDSYFLLDRGGKALAAAGLNMTLRDLARFALLLQNNGIVAGREVIPVAVIKTLKRGGDINHFPNRNGSQWSYKSQWWFDGVNGGMMALGIHGQAIYIGIGDGVVIVSNSSWPSANLGNAGLRRYNFHTIVKAALNAVD